MKQAKVKGKSGARRSAKRLPGTGTVTENTPSQAQYFSWINNTNEGSTEAQTLTNLRFFEWLRREYGMQLDLYAFDAGNIDGAKFYGRMNSERFRRQFPRGFGPISEAAGALGIRLGLWGGPDGFGDTAQEAEDRHRQMVSLCRDHGFALFKFDGVCGGLRKEKQAAFVRMMRACRKYVPDLILLNHRLDFGIGQPYATTFLWEGAETYIDVHMPSRLPALHNRLGALQRGLPPDLVRLTEDHGVCLSSCLDYWEEDLVLQSFNRGLILAPQLYGNPWLLRDDEFPRLARLFNLHRRHRDILVEGLALPEQQYGPHAVSRGDHATRFLALRNFGWEPQTFEIQLDEAIGLGCADRVEIRRQHPYQKFLGAFDWGSRVPVEVRPQRSCLLMVTTGAPRDVDVRGCDYEVTRDVPGRPIELRIYGMPGTKARVEVVSDGESYRGARLDGRSSPGLLSAEGTMVEFPGPALKQPWHRKLGALKTTRVPDDAESLYEATCFAADNNALEVRELARSGPTTIPEVAAAREAFFNQPVLRRRGLWDRNLFDGNPDTSFDVCRRWGRDLRVRSGAFRLDLGAPTRIDRLELIVGGDYNLQPLKSEEAVTGAVSADLSEWTPIRLFAEADIVGEIPGAGPVRYLRLDQCPDRIHEVRGSYRGKALDRTGWRASNLFAAYRSAPAVAAWSLKTRLTEVPAGAYLAVPMYGAYGSELVYAAARVDGRPVGAPRRSPSYPSNTWECPVRVVDGNYSAFFPLTPDVAGKRIEVVVLGLRGAELSDFHAEVWLTAYPTPFVSRTLELVREDGSS